MVAIQMDKPNTSLARATTHAKGGLPSDQHSRQPPIRDRMPPCSPPSRCGLAIAQYDVDVGAPADLDGACARRPEKFMAGAEECLRRGRTKEWEEDGAQN